MSDPVLNQWPTQFRIVNIEAKKVLAFDDKTHRLVAVPQDNSDNRQLWMRKIAKANPPALINVGNSMALYSTRGALSIGAWGRHARFDYVPTKRGLKDSSGFFLEISGGINGTSVAMTRTFTGAANQTWQIQAGHIEAKNNYQDPMMTTGGTGYATAPTNYGEKGPGAGNGGGEGYGGGYGPSAPPPAYEKEPS
eukprot:CAMPEP_0167787612 /NCGR_PEP_ID=MMETSP0111_2-20121227/9538_1 /TAXON_ID=91324 /ORGANISM="Lotharella globosa, Strain CCCM811" /LENGTH=193 /DNA_ID=CAMNT_0007679311 /DNA_START=110 /DNA_END=691 /DNA_ORIENTATION=+